jgi:hypothetical protein
MTVVIVRLGPIIDEILPSSQAQVVEIGMTQVDARINDAYDHTITGEASGLVEFHQYLVLVRPSGQFHARTFDYFSLKPVPDGDSYHRTGDYNGYNHQYGDECAQCFEVLVQQRLTRKDIII